MHLFIVVSEYIKDIYLSDGEKYEEWLITAVLKLIERVSRSSVLW